METRSLYILGLSLAAVVGGFYYFSGKGKTLERDINHQLHSSASHIRVIQTREDGQLYAKASTPYVQQWMKAGKAQANELQGQFYQNGRQTVDFYAKKAVASNNYQDLALLDGVKITQRDAQGQPSLSFTTDRLYGNVQSDHIYTDRPVQVDGTNVQFRSQGLKGNWSTGIYEFSSIRGSYDPTP